MSVVYEVVPPTCPQCHAPRKPGTYLVGWDAQSWPPHRTWTCLQCRHVEHARSVELREVA
ncbi:hypothetical protein [Corynebacterium vitaeruminis]|uniref:hypothetical protein n=1 Tax=Corynebacterium vitaeruminis TaxID=38305 RepID=UPI0012DDC935|nr:hypothetical protein [Corynebacterium vitaeruminis]